jgi:hypothetical protein
MRKKKTRNLLMKSNSTKEDVSDLDIIIVRLFQKSVESMSSTSSEIALNKIDESDCKMNEIEKTTNDEMKSENIEKINEMIISECDENESMKEEIKKKSIRSDDDSVEKDNSRRKLDRKHLKRDVARQSKHKKKLCKCISLTLALLERIRRKNAIRTRMKDDAECIDTLREMIEARLNKTSLRHVCHRHLYVLERHFDLQIKKLKTTNLKQRLNMI